MPPIGVVSALGVVGAGGAGVVFSGLGERGEAIVLRGAGRRQNAFVGFCSVCVLIFPTARSTVRRCQLTVFHETANPNFSMGWWIWIS